MTFPCGKASFHFLFQEINFLKTMMAKMTERMDRMEKAVEIRIG